MSMTGDDGRISFDLEVDATAAADKTEAAFKKALTDAIGSAEVKAKFDELARNALKSITSTLGTGGKAGLFTGLTQDAGKAQKTVDAEFAKMRKSIDKLADTVKKNAKAMRDIGDAAKKSAQQAAAATKAATASADQQRRLDIVRLQTSQHAVRDATRERISLDQQATKRAADLLRARTAAEQNATRLSVEETKARTALELSEQRKRLEFIRTFRQQLVMVERAIGYAFRTGVRVASAALRTLRQAATAAARASVTAFQGVQRLIGNAFTGAVRAARAALSGLGTIAAGSARAVGRAFSRIANLMVAPFRAAFNTIRGLFRSHEANVNQSIGRQQSAFSRLTSATGLGLLAGGAGIGRFLTGGFRRAGEEESLQLALSTILGSADEATRKLQDISDYARTTAFDFVGLSEAVLGFTAVTGDIDRAEGLTKFLADMVALTGGSSSQFDKAALAFQQIISAGRLEGDELRQLGESLPGVPIADIIIDKFFDGSREAFAKARRQGKLGEIIDDEAFFAALTEGVQERFPQAEGAAQRLATTLTGLTQNLQENFEIFGATIINLVSGPIKSFIGGMNDLLDSLGRFVAGEGLSEAATKLRDMIGAAVKAIGILGGLRLAFSAIGGAISIATSPITFFVAAAGAIGVGLQQAYRVSERFRYTLEVLGNQIRPTVEALVDLGKALLDFVFGGGSGDGDGPVGFFKRIGDAMRYVNVWAARVIVMVRALALAFTSWLRGNDLAGQEGSRSRVAARILGNNIFGLDPEEITEALDRGGNDILNVLELSWAGPIVRFFRGLARRLAPVVGLVTRVFKAVAGAIVTAWKAVVAAISTAIRGITNFFSGLFDAIFGDDDETGDGRRGRGRQSLGERLKQFFTADSAIAPIVNFFIDLYNSVKSYVEPAFSAIANAFRSAWEVVQPIIQPLIDGFAKVIDMIRNLDFSDLNLGNVAKGAGIGGGIGLVLGGPLGALLGGGIGALTQTPIFDGLVDSFGNLWGLIQPKLESMWSSLTSWLASHFTAEKLKGYAVGFLGLVREIGRIVGSIVTDPLFLAGVAGLAAAAATVVGAFVVGFGEAALENAAQIAGYLADAIEAGWNSLKAGALDFIPDPIADAIGALLGNPALATAIGLFGLGLAARIFTAIQSSLASRSAGKAAGTKFSFTGLGASIATSMINAISRAFSAIWKGGAALFTGKNVGQGGFGIGEGNIFHTRGQAIGSAIAAGIGSAIVGYAAGRSGSEAAIVGAIFGGAAAGASLGTVIAPGVGTAIGAVLGAGAAGIGAFFGNAARKAEEAKEAVREFTDALLSSGEAGARASIMSSLLDESEAAREGVALLDIKWDEFVRRLTDTDAATTAGQVLADSLARLRDSAPTQESADIFNALASAAASFGDSLPSGGDAFSKLVRRAGLDLFEVTGALEAAGIDVEALGAGLQFVGQQQNGLKGAAGALRDIGESVGTVDEAVQRIRGALASGGLGRDIAEVLGNPDLTTAEGMEALARVAEDVKDQIEDARQALVDFIIGPDSSGKQPELRRQIQLDAADFQEQLDRIRSEEGANPFRVRLEVEQSTADFIDGIRQSLADAVESGAISTPEQWDAAIADLNAGLEEALSEGLITPETKAVIEGVINDPVFGDSVRDMLDDVAALLDQNTVLEDAARRLIGRFQTVMNNPENFSFNQASMLEDTRFGRQALSSGSSTDSPASLAGSGAGDGFAAGFDSSGTRIRQQIQSTVSEAFSGSNTSNTIVAIASGVKIAADLAAGLSSNRGPLVAAGSSAGGAAAQGVLIARVAMYLAGLNLMSSLAQGIRDRAAAAAVAAAAAAAAVAAAARRALGIASPSKVFRNIGRDVGRGFVAGIEDAEGDMTRSLTNAIDKVISDAQNTTRARSAQAASAIFGALAPSVLPGGATLASQQRALLEQRQNVLGFGAGLRSRAAESFGASGSATLLQAAVGRNDAVRQFALAFESLNDEVQEAVDQRNALTGYQRTLSALWKQAQAGTLGEVRAARLRGEAYADLRDDQQKLNDQIAKLTANFQAGRIKAKEYNERIAELKSNFNVTSLAQYQDTLAGINAQLKTGRLNTEEWRERLAALGDRPEALNLTQRNLLATGSRSLATNTAAGVQNREAIDAAANSIREWGQAALEAGASAATVKTTMLQYVQSLRLQANQLGFNIAEIDKILAAYNLNSASLEKWRKGLVDLSTNTLEGVTNRLEILSQLEQVREFGQASLDVGGSIKDAVNNMRTMRNQILATAKAFGFNSAQLDALVNLVGLSDSALADFVKQMQEFEKAASQAASKPPAQQQPDRLDRPSVEATINITPPYGNAEAIGLSVVNELAFALAE